MQFDRKSRPKSLTQINFIPPSIQSFSLRNGLKIYFNEKNELPIVRMNLIFNCGSKYDEKDKKGLSNVLSMCIDEGAGSFNALQLADEFEVLGASFNVSCDNDIIIMSLQVLSENFSAALALIGSIVLNPHLSEGDFNREKHKLLIRLHQAQTEPDYIADVAFEYFLFGKDSPYAYPTSGIEQCIPNIQINTVRDLYDKTFIPSNSYLVIVGNINRVQLKNELESVFKTWSGNQLIKQELLSKVSYKSKTFIIEKPGATQTEIRIGHLSSQRNENDFYHKQIINLILGGQFSSRLNINLREKNGYTYGINSQFNYLKEAGFFCVSTSVDSANTLKALKEIFYEIKEIKKGIISKELIFAKSSITNKYPLNFETYRQISANITAKVIHNLPENYFETYIKKISELSLDDVNSIASSSIHPDQLTTVLVGDSKNIIIQLDELDLGEVEVLEFDEIFKR